MTKQDAGAGEAVRPAFRWSRKRDRRIITIEEAAVGEVAEQMRAAAAVDDAEVAEQKRAAAEQRARDLELVVEKLSRRLHALQATVRIVQQRAAHLERENREERENRAGRLPGGDSHAELAAPAADAVTLKLFAEVGLTPACTDFALDAVRRAYLRHYHPDGHADPGDKARATAEFQFYARIFAAIAERRGRRPPP